MSEEDDGDVFFDVGDNLEDNNMKRTPPARSVDASRGATTEVCSYRDPASLFSLLWPCGNVEHLPKTPSFSAPLENQPVN